MKDPILQELWKTKDKIAKECGYNIDKLAKRLEEKEKKEGSTPKKLLIFGWLQEMDLSHEGLRHT